MVKSVVTGLLSNHYFTQSDKIRDTSIECLLMKMYDHDFGKPHLQHCANKISTNYNKSSNNDRKFLDLMDQKAVKIDGNYELLLKLKDEDISSNINEVIRPVLNFFFFFFTIKFHKYKKAFFYQYHPNVDLV